MFQSSLDPCHRLQPTSAYLNHYGEKLEYNHGTFSVILLDVAQQRNNNDCGIHTYRYLYRELEQWEPFEVPHGRGSFVNALRVASYSGVEDQQVLREGPIVKCRAAFSALTPPADPPVSKDIICCGGIIPPHLPPATTNGSVARPTR